jgi:hypothetical protein
MNLHVTLSGRRYLLAILSLLLFILVNACSPVTKTEPPKASSLDSTLQVPESELSVPIFYPLADLEALVNGKLENKIIEAKIAIDEKKRDSLFLSISRFKPVDIDYDGTRGITCSVPLKISGLFDTKVAGIKVKNKTPVEAMVIITVFTELTMNETWNLDTKTEIKNIEWVQDPKLNIAGIKWNLRPPMEKAIKKNEDKIIEKLDSSIGELINLRKIVEKLWMDIQKPIRINKKVVPAWLKAELIDMDGRILRRSKDTLMIEVGLKSLLRTVLDSAAAMKNLRPLPPFHRKKKNDPGLAAHVLATVPFDQVNKVLTQVTDTMKFEFGSRSVKVKEATMFGTDKGIAIKIGLQGDLTADLFVMGSIGYDSTTQTIALEDFVFDINSESSLVGAADWLAHDAIIDRIKPYLSLPVGNIFSMLPTLITKGIEKGKIGKKIEVRFSDLDVDIKEYLITRDNLQIVLSAQGGADVQLQKGLFEKKKKKPA